MTDIIIKNEAELRQYIKPYVKQLDKRIQSQLDEISIEYIERTRLCILYTGTTQKIHSLKKIERPIHDLNTLALTGNHTTNQTASLYCLIPGITHGLRINGKLIQNRFEIKQVYFQCGRAMMRAQLWEDKQKPSHQYVKKQHHKLTNEVRSFLQSNQYALIGTQDTQGNTELSPRGNGSSLLTVLNDNTVMLKEHTGNKVAISLRNILQNPNVSLLLISRGEHQALSIKGKAVILTCESASTKPNIHIKITIESVQFITLPNAHDLWDNQTYIDKNNITPFATAINTHMNGQGLLSKLTQPLVNAVVEHDQKNLY